MDLVEDAMLNHGHIVCTHYGRILVTRCKSNDVYEREILMIAGLKLRKLLFGR